MPPNFQPRVDDGQMVSSTVARMPSSRSYLAVVEWHDRIYLVGGKSRDSASAAAWVFDPYTRRFDEMPSMEQARMGHGAAIYQHRLLVFGGNGENSAILNTMEAFDLDKKTWSNAGTMPFARTRFGLACLGNQVWVAGGSDGQRPTAELHAFDPAKGTWQRKADMPEPRERLALVALRGELYAIGGEGTDHNGSKTVWRYSPASDSWSPATKLNTARRNFSAVRVGDQIVVAGGWDHVDDEKVFPPQVDVLESRTNKWVSHGHLEAPREGCRAVAWRGRVLVFGGYGRDIVPYAEEIQWRSQVRDWRMARAAEPVLLSRADLPAGEGARELEPRPVVPGGHPSFMATDFGLPDAARGEWVAQAHTYPSHLSPEASMRHALAPFVAGVTAGWGSVAQMCNGSRVVVDKIAAAGSEMSPLRIPASPLVEGSETVTPQDFLDRSVVSTAVYVGPDQGGRSRRGEGGPGGGRGGEGAPPPGGSAGGGPGGNPGGAPPDGERPQGDAPQGDAPRGGRPQGEGPQGGPPPARGTPGSRGPEAHPGRHGGHAQVPPRTTGPRLPTGHRTGHLHALLPR